MRKVIRTFCMGVAIGVFSSTTLCYAKDVSLISDTTQTKMSGDIETETDTNELSKNEERTEDMLQWDTGISEYFDLVRSNTAKGELSTGIIDS